METAAAAPTGAKKRKSRGIEGREAEKLEEATEKPDPKSTAKKRTCADNEEPHLPGAEEDGGGVDRISELPDDVLCDIVSLLSTKDGARTQALATRWCHIWCTAPLNLDCGDLLVADGEALADLVPRILDAHRGSGRRLCVPARHIHDQPAAMDALLRSPALDNLKELNLWYFPVYYRYSRLVHPLPQLPESTYRFSSTLTVATIGQCHLPDGTAQALHFPKLRQLALEHVQISEGSLHDMIAGCPTLECLLLTHNRGYHSLRINSTTLRSIGLRADYIHEEGLLKELIIEDAPCLERLLHVELNTDVDISVISAPKLETLGFLTDWCQKARFVFGSTVIEGLRVDSLGMVMRTVKILALNMRFLCLDSVIKLMRCFPCLEKLYMKSCTTGWANLWRRKHLNFLKCSDIHLKTLVLENYRGIKSQASFVMFFVLNASALELMRLEVAPEDYNEAFLAHQRKELQLENAVSRRAQFEFVTHKCRHSASHIEHVRDLDIADPYECKC